MKRVELWEIAKRGEVRGEGRAGSGKVTGWMALISKINGKWKVDSQMQDAGYLTPGTAGDVSLLVGDTASTVHPLVSTVPILYST
jgi:hypothetical protein